MSNDNHKETDLEYWKRRLKFAETVQDEEHRLTLPAGQVTTMYNRIRLCKQMISKLEGDK